MTVVSSCDFLLVKILTYPNKSTILSFLIRYKLLYVSWLL